MTANKRYRAGVIGAGAIAQACHVPGYVKHARAELVAFSDPTKARHKEMAELAPGAKGYTDHEAMLREAELDVVSVCAPNALHAPISIAALKEGCHVLCEKPMAITLAEADKMIAAAKAARKKLMIGFTQRMLAGPLACKELLSKKALGKIFSIRVRVAHGGPLAGWAKDKWFYDPAQAAGGALLDLGIHALDQCFWLVGPATAVWAKTQTFAKKTEVDDNALIMLEFVNGALGSIEVGWTSKPGFNGIEIYGLKGSLICDFNRGVYLCGGTASAGQDGVAEWSTIQKNPTKGGWDVEIDHWMDVVTGKTRLTMDGEAGRAALEAALAAYKSSRTGKRVALTRPG